MNNLRKHHGAGPPEARVPMQLHHLHRHKAGPADNNSICAGFTVKLPKKMLIQITFKDEGYDKHDSTKEQRNNETMSNVKLQVLTICYLSDLNNKFHY